MLVWKDCDNLSHSEKRHQARCIMEAERGSAKGGLRREGGKELGEEGKRESTERERSLDERERERERERETEVNVKGELVALKIGEGEKAIESSFSLAKNLHRVAWLLRNALARASELNGRDIGIEAPKQTGIQIPLQRLLYFAVELIETGKMTLEPKLLRDMAWERERDCAWELRSRGRERHQLRERSERDWNCWEGNQSRRI